MTWAGEAGLLDKVAIGRGWLIAGADKFLLQGIVKLAIRAPNLDVLPSLTTRLFRLQEAWLGR